MSRISWGEMRCTSRHQAQRSPCWAARIESAVASSGRLTPFTHHWTIMSTPNRTTWSLPKPTHAVGRHSLIGYLQVPPCDEEGSVDGESGLVPVLAVSNSRGRKASFDWPDWAPSSAALIIVAPISHASALVSPDIARSLNGSTATFNEVRLDAVLAQRAGSRNESDVLFESRSQDQLVAILVAI